MFVCTILSLFVLTLFSGCGVYSSIDLEKVKSDIALLRTTSIDLVNIEEVLEQNSSLFGILEEIELDSLPFDKEYIEKENGELLFFSKQGKEEFHASSFTFYMIVKPALDKKELLENQIEKYFYGLMGENLGEKQTSTTMSKNIMKKELDGYLIYILSYDNEIVWERIKENAYPLLFQNAKEASAKDFSLNMDDLKEFQAIIPNEMKNASFYVIVKPKNGKVESVKKELDQYMKELEKKWSTYLPDQYQIVKNRMETEVGSYFIYIGSTDNQLVLKTIKDAVMKKD